MLFLLIFSFLTYGRNCLFYVGSISYFLKLSDYTPLIVLNQDGSLYQMVATAPEYDNRDCKYSMRSSQMGDGRLIMWTTEGKNSTWYDYELGKEPRKLTKFDNFQNHGSFRLTEDGYCYLLSSSWLYRWDIFTGKSIKVMNLENEGISENMANLKITLQENGLPILCNNKGEYLEVYRLTEQKPDTSNYFTVVSFYNNCKELEVACADYTRTHPGNGVWVEKPSKDVDAYRTKLLAEMVAGRGPDAMYVSPADMKMFYEKGVLEDMTGCLSPDLEKQIFNGVLDCGKVDGKQIGFPLVADLSAMLVDQSLWDKDSWNLQDMENLIREGKVPNLKMIVMLDSEAWKGPTYHQGVLEALILKDLNNTPFLNVEESICNFDSPEFIKLLELCKEYPQTIEAGGASVGYREGTLLGYVGAVSNAWEFGYTMLDCEDTLKCVGFPTEEGSGCYWECDYLLVVRKGFDKKDVIAELMEALYAANNQRKMRNPVNRRVFELYVSGPRQGILDATNELKYYYSVEQGDYSSYPIAAKKDGASWIPEYIALADKAVPLPHVADIPAQIVREEAKEFFSGNKDAASVAKIIQNRVKLWLMEQM